MKSAQIFQGFLVSSLPGAIKIGVKSWLVKRMSEWYSKVSGWLVFTTATSGLLALLLLGRNNAIPLLWLKDSSVRSEPASAPAVAEGDRVYLSYQQWVALLKQEAIVAAQQKPKRLTVLAGDSISLWFPPELLPTGVSWLNQGISGETSYGLLMRLKLFDAVQPETILVMIGINDLVKDIRRVTIVENQREIVRHLKLTHPRARIVIQSILPHGGSRLAQYPRTANTPVWVDRFSKLPNQEIQQLNQRLQQVAKEEKVVFLDLFPHFLDDQGNLRSTLTTDGLHLSWAGYELWRSRLHAFDSTLFLATSTSSVPK
jgi:lysophospholipase L1-like esterase